MRTRSRFPLPLSGTAVGAVLATAVVVLVVGAPGSTPTLTRGPYLQWLTTNAVTIVWNTGNAAACSVKISSEGDTATVLDGDFGTVCAIPVESLSPGTRYFYTPLANGSPLHPESVFQTDDPALPFSFSVLGDSGSGSPNQLAVRDAMLATPADFILHVGDMVLDDGAPEDFDPKLFTPYADLLRRLVLWPCRGNHDIRTDDGAPWREAFFTPANNPAGTEDYYSFDFGNAHVAVLDSNADTSPGSPQHTFLDADLGTTSATWKFVAFHHTIYSSGRHGSSLERRADLAPLFDAHGVDIVFMGHDHHYERTKPLRGDQIVAEGEGTVYITTGGGGQPVRSVGSSDFTVYAESAFHFTRLVVDDTWLVAQMVREDGLIRDSMTLVKGAPPAPPVCGDGFVNQGEELCDGDDHAACPQGCDTDCACLPVCGDGAVNSPTEECDGGDDTVCPDLCLSNCRCGDPEEVVYLAPIADTYIIEGGKEASQNHGGADELKIDNSPPAIAYLKFDLGSVTMPIREATLTLNCTDPSPDGGTAFPVADSSWIEGSGTGSGKKDPQDPGLTWVDVDTNRDGEIDSQDTSPYVPDFAQPLGRLGIVTEPQTYAVDVTAALQHGPGLYTLAVKNYVANGATYPSREHSSEATHPQLRLELAIETPCTADADCNDEIPCTADACVDGLCTNIADDGTCDDGQFCNGTEWCDVSSGCRQGDPPCDDGIDCTLDTCDEGSNGCGHAPDHGLCVDANVCNGEETCDAHSGCQLGAAADGIPCDDGDPCTITDTCGAGLCRGSPMCGNGVVDIQCGETCDGAEDESCDSGCTPPGQPGECTCLGVGRCGDGEVNQASEMCDGTDDDACPGNCKADCTCKVVGTVEADVSVRETDPAENFGSSDRLWADASSMKRTFLRTRVIGVGARRIGAARLRLQVADTSGAPSDSGGRIHTITDCSWNELTATWNTQPAIDGANLDEFGPVQQSDVVEFNVTQAIQTDGTYCFALDSLSSDGVTYNSREATGGRPELQITLDTPCVSDADCDDSDPCTGDTCDLTTGECSREVISDDTACPAGVCCSGACVPPACSSDADCDDANACTDDSCLNGSTCSASCVTTWPACGVADDCCGPVCSPNTDPDCPATDCGNGICEGAGEDCFTCPADCRCTGRGCSKSCCGDGLCVGENARQCPVDCGS